jgi:eukaryotic-like serine/threonine-protein kinase
MSPNLLPGAHLGRYEIKSQLGAGGMGELYLAEDTRLHRRVALKILPAELIQNKDRLRRFEQEAEAAAGLNHPNLAHVYETDEIEGQHFIAMEFVDVQSTARRSAISGAGEEIRYAAVTRKRS